MKISHEGFLATIGAAVCVLLIVAVGLMVYLLIKVNTVSSATQALLTSGKTTAAETGKQNLEDTRKTLALFAAIEEQFGVIIIANHFTTDGEMVNCTTNPVAFTVKCSLVKK